MRASKKYTKFIGVGTTVAIPTQDAAPTTGNSTTGWIVAKLATTYGVEMKSGVKRPAADFTTYMTPAFDPSLATDCIEFIVPDIGQGTTCPLTKLEFSYEIAATTGGAQDGNIEFRMYYDPNTGSWTELQHTINTTVSGTTFLNISTTPVTQLFTFKGGSSPSNSTFPGEIYLPAGSRIRIAIGWRMAGAGGSNSADIVFRDNASTAYMQLTFADATAPEMDQSSETSTEPHHICFGGLYPALCVLDSNNGGYPAFDYERQFVFKGSPTKAAARLTTGPKALISNARAVASVSAALTAPGGSNCVMSYGKLLRTYGESTAYLYYDDAATVPTWALALKSFATSPYALLYPRVAVDPAAEVPTSVTLGTRFLAGVLPASATGYFRVSCYMYKDGYTYEAWRAQTAATLLTDADSTVMLPVTGTYSYPVGATFDHLEVTWPTSTNATLPMVTALRLNSGVVATQPVSATASAVASASANMIVGNSVGVALAAAVATVSASLYAPVRFRASASALAAVTATLFALQHIRALAAASGTASPALTTEILLSAMTESKAQGLVWLTAYQHVRVLAQAAVSVSAAFTNRIRFAAGCRAEASATATLTNRPRAAAHPSGNVTVTAELRTRINVDARANVVASVRRARLASDQTAKLSSASGRRIATAKTNQTIVSAR